MSTLLGQATHSGYTVALSFELPLELKRLGSVLGIYFILAG
jgi:hypothetical protein